jgi:hypothetical protein
MRPAREGTMVSQDVIIEIVAVGQGEDQAVGFVFLEDNLTPRGLISLPHQDGRRFVEVTGDCPDVLSRRLRRIMEGLAQDTGRDLAWLCLPAGYTGEDLVADLRRQTPPGSSSWRVLGTSGAAH